MMLQADLLEPGRTVLGGIDLDPASCAAANAVIRADRFFDRALNGFAKEWRGTVWLNPPGGLCDRDGRPVYPKTEKRDGCSITGACQEATSCA